MQKKKTYLAAHSSSFFKKRSLIGEINKYRNKNHYNVCNCKQLESFGIAKRRKKTFNDYHHKTLLSNKL